MSGRYVSMVDEEEDISPIRRAVRSLFAVYLAVFLLLIGVGIAVTFFGDPHAGLPVAKLDVTLAKKTHNPPPAVAKAEPSPIDNGLIEQTDLGPLPKIAADGTTPMKVYGGADPGAGAKIVLVVSGLGVGGKETETALNMLPTGVTLAFSPYAGDVQRWAANARSRGHEVLIAIPMEPYDYPDNDPGQYGLKVAGGEEANQQRLRWVLTRIAGYTGATNMFGERFMAEPKALAPILCFLAQRGLLFFDSGTVANTKATEAAQTCKTAYVRASVRIDSIPTAGEIDRQLAGLEAQAKARGMVVASAELSPLMLERLALWAQGLNAKGIVLVPVSAVASPAK